MKLSNSSFLEKEKENPELKKVQHFININLYFLQKMLLKTKNLSDEELDLYLILNIFLNEWSEVTVENLQKNLEKFQAHNSNFDYVSNFGRLNIFQRFLKDLNYIKLFEKEGIAGLNTYLANLFKQLKDNKWNNDGTMENINDIIGRVVQYFPHVINSIEVNLKPNINEKDIDLQDSVDLRKTLMEYNKKLESEGKNKLSEVITPLPWGRLLNTPCPLTAVDAENILGETHPLCILQEELNMKRIQGETCYFGKAYDIDWDEFPILSLCLHKEEPMSGYNNVYLRLNEVENIKFSSREDFTPLLQGKQFINAKSTSEIVLGEDFISKVLKNLKKRMNDVIMQKFMKTSISMESTKTGNWDLIIISEEVRNLLKSILKENTEN